jgi:hypothetical protein
MDEKNAGKLPKEVYPSNKLQARPCVYLLLNSIRLKGSRRSPEKEYGR